MTNAATTAQLSEDGGPKIRLGIMMFLQYADLGSLACPMLAIYLMADRGRSAGLDSVGADVGYWISRCGRGLRRHLRRPSSSGQIADRKVMNAEICTSGSFS